MNENTFLNLGNKGKASQPIGMGPMGGAASSMPPAPGADPMMGGYPNAMGVPNAMPPAGGDPSMMGGYPNAMGVPNAPVMGANPFDGGEGDADVSGDPAKKAESLAGQLASIFRNDLKNDGINTHEDKKKEVLGMITAAIVDGMSDEDRNSMIDYLSDKLNGSGESDGDSDDGSRDMDGDPSQQIMELKVNEVVNEIIGDLTKKKVKPAAKVDQEEKQGYKGKPYQVKK